jgi:penicillin-binding protein 1C
VRAATLAWFGKEPGRLTPAEAALLVALPQSPEARRPDRHRRAARVARDRVLARMQKAGVLSPEAAHAALTEPVPVERRGFPANAPHLADRAVAQAPFAGDHRLTLDAGLQRRLERLARRTVASLPPETSIAMLVADHRTGAILASVGSADYAAPRQGYVDMTRAARSPGSVLKPLIYALAFDRGLAHPRTLISDRPVSFGTYAPQNFDGGFRGDLPVAEALRLSLNVPAVLLLDEIGPARLMAAMRRAGLAPDLPGDQAGLAVGLGGVGLSLHELVQLYAGLANAGQARPLHWRAGASAGAGPRLVSRASAWQVGDILADLVPPPGAPSGRLAYKTGTSYGHRDAWAVGYDGAHVAGVWIGRPDGTPVPGAFGGDLAAPVLFDVFQRLKSAPDALPPPPPEALLVSTAELPQPLRRFRGRQAAFRAAPDGPRLVFPPPDARIPLAESGLPVKLRAGTPPFTWLADGRPVLTDVRRRAARLPGLSQGFSTISVIDAEGRGARVTVRIE